MATPSTMIINSLIMLGDKVIGGTLSSAEQTHYLARLNTMIESWSLNRLMCYQIVQESLALTTSDGTYTVGSGGDFNTARPTKIVDPCFTRDASGNDFPIEIVNAEAYGRITSKTTDGGYPQYLFYDSAFVTSLGTIFLWPEPSASLTLYINSWKQLQTFSTISTTVVLPPGYERAIETNFAIEVSPGFIDPSPALVKTARDSKAAIMSLNAPAGVLRLDPGLVGGQRSNILTG